MKEKYFNVNELNVGCLGSVCYLGPGKGADWTKKEINPYIAFREFPSETLDNCHEAKNVFHNDKYYFLNEVSGNDNRLECVNGKYVIGKKVPLSVVIGGEVKKISSVELKSILCNFNIIDALIKSKNDGYLILLKKCIDDIDLMGDGKVKEYYVENISTLITDYINAMSDTCIEGKNFDNIVYNINLLRQELDKEKEIIAKKRKKLNKDFTK